MNPSQCVNLAPLTSYGDFGNLPREIRDMIWAEYFSVATLDTLRKYLESTKSEPTLYITKPDTGLLRASRALYQEIKSFWKDHYKGTRLFRTAASLTHPLKTDRFLTLSVQSLPKAPLYSINRSTHITWLSYSWLYSPRLNMATSVGHLERARIVFPNLRYFLKTDKSEMDRSMELFVRLLGASSWRVRGRLNFFIEDASWPLPQPGENVWYKRLHQGMTRRSLMRSKQAQFEIIIQRLSDIIFRFRKLVATVSFTFGDSEEGYYKDKAGEVRHIVSALKNEVRDTGIVIDYMRLYDDRVFVRSP